MEALPYFNDGSGKEAQQLLGISRFYGIVIAMFYGDHDPPHFHAIYAEHRAIIGIETLGVLAGSLSERALNMMLEWAQQH